MNVYEKDTLERLESIRPGKLEDKYWWLFCDPDTEPPRFKHDCDHCVFAGLLFNGPDSFYADIYVCNHTVIFRVGDDGPDYWSMDMRGSVNMIFSESALGKIALAIYMTIHMPGYTAGVVGNQLYMENGTIYLSGE